MAKSHILASYPPHETALSRTVSVTKPSDQTLGPTSAFSYANCGSQSSHFTPGAQRHQKAKDSLIQCLQMVTLGFLKPAGPGEPDWAAGQHVDSLSFNFIMAAATYNGTLEHQMLKDKSVVMQVNFTNFTHGRNKLMTELLKRLWQEEEGQDLTEYALLLVLIALAAIAVMGTLGNAINAVFSSAASTLNNASTSAGT